MGRSFSYMSFVQGRRAQRKSTVSFQNLATQKDPSPKTQHINSSISTQLK
eukprot:m.26072 g.26072  ORF g.26072 m.26072 type:complete len:50 (+) comp38131_c0_seq2:290-439(+)